MVSRAEEIEQRLRDVPFSTGGPQYVVGERVPEWYLSSVGVNTLQVLVAEDIPYLLARIRELEGALSKIAQSSAALEES